MCELTLAKTDALRMFGTKLWGTASLFDKDYIYVETYKNVLGLVQYQLLLKKNLSEKLPNEM